MTAHPTVRDETRWRAQVFTPFPEVPEISFARAAARSPAFGRTSAAGGDRVLIGSAAGTDPADVAVRARGELLERMGNVLAGRAAEAAGRTVASLAELRRRGVSLLEPTRQDTESRRLWVAGESLITGARVLVPAESCFLHHRPPPGCRPAAQAGSTGLAAHPEPAAAVEHAAWEILERELVRRSWSAPRAYPPIRLALMRQLEAHTADLIAAKGLHATALVLPAPAGVCCVVVCVHRPDGSGQSFGARCGPAQDAADALNRAAYEALTVRWSLDTPVARRALAALARRTVPRGAVEHALWAFHRQDSLAHWLNRDAPPQPLPGHGAPSAVQVLVEYGRSDVVAVETTPDLVRAEGLTVVRVIAPSTRPLSSTAEPGVPPHPFG